MGLCKGCAAMGPESEDEVELEGLAVDSSSEAGM